MVEPPDLRAQSGHDRNHDSWREQSDLGRELLEIRFHPLPELGRQRLNPSRQRTGKRLIPYRSGQPVIPRRCREDLIRFELVLEVGRPCFARTANKVWSSMTITRSRRYSSARSGSSAPIRATAAAYVPSRSSSMITAPTSGEIDVRKGPVPGGRSSPASSALRRARATSSRSSGSRSTGSTAMRLRIRPFGPGWVGSLPSSHLNLGSQPPDYRTLASSTATARATVSTGQALGPAELLSFVALAWSSSAAEHPALNREGAGSSPASMSPARLPTGLARHAVVFQGIGHPGCRTVAAPHGVAQRQERPAGTGRAQVRILPPCPWIETRSRMKLV